MKNENALLVGGSRDGEWIEVQEGLPLIRLPVLRQLPTMRRIDELAVQAAAVAFEHEEYYLTKISDEGGTRHPVYVTRGVNLVDALLNGYRRPK